MAGTLGPRVGGAHVDVNMQMDEKSIASVGKSIHRQLSSLSNSLEKIGERNRAVYQGIGQSAVTAWRSALGIVVTSAPLMGSAISAVSGATTMLAGSLYSVGQSSGALIPIMTSLGLAGLTASIGLNNFGAAVSEVNPKRLEQLLEGMPKSMQNAVMATRKLSNEMRAAVWPKLFQGLSDGIESLRDTGVIQRGLGAMAEQMNGLARSVLRYANTKEGVKTLNSFFQNNAKVFGALSKAVVPFLDGFLRLVNALTPAAIRFSKSLTDVGKSFQSWTKGEGFAKRVDESMKSAQKTAGLLFKVLGNLGSAIMNIFNAANPSTNTFLQMLVDVTQKFEDWTSSVGGQNSIATWAAQSGEVMRQFGKTAEAVFKVIAELADPRVITSFLATVEGAFNLLGQLPLDKMVEAFVTVSEALQPVSSFFLAIVIAGASLSIMLGSLMGQFGGFFGILIKFLRFRIIVKILRDLGGGALVAGSGAEGAAKKSGLLSRAWDALSRIISKVKNAFSGVVGFFTKTEAAVGPVASKVGKLTKAFTPLMSILGRFAKFAGPVGLAIWIGSIIAKSDKLKSKFGDIWDAVKEVGSALGGAFEEIGTALKPLAPVAEAAGKAFGFIFDMMDKIAEIAIGAVLDMIVFGFKSLANVITGAGHIIAGFINVLIGLFTLDFGKVWDGLKQMASGVGPLLKGLLGLFFTFFAPARLAKLGLVAMKGLGGGLKAAAPGILSAIGQFALAALKFFVELAPKLLALGGKAFMALGRAVITNAPKILASVGRLVGHVIVWIAKLVPKLLRLGVQAIGKLGLAIIRGTPKVLAAAGRIVAGVIRWIARLPGRLLSLGVQAVGKLASAVIRGTPKVLAAAGRILSGVVKWIAKLPGKLLDLGRDAIGKLGSAISTGVGKLRNAAGSVVDAVVKAVKELPGKLYSIGAEMIGKMASGMISKLGSIASAASSVANKVKDIFPGSPVKEGPLTAWNYGGDASGGGRNIIDALVKGLSYTAPIEKAAEDVAESMRAAFRAPTSQVQAGAGAGAGQPTQFPRRLILRIGNRDFEAYVSEVADGRIDAADNLAWQGA